MKILIVSDTHRSNNNFLKVLERVGMPDMLIHCGDVSGSEYFYTAAVSCPVVMVRGNNDFSFELKDEEELDIEGHHILVTHGDIFGVSYSKEKLVRRAAQLKAEVVLFGHTHVPEVTYCKERNIYAVNPGSLTYPRQEGRKPSYIIMDISEGKAPCFSVDYL